MVKRILLVILVLLAAGILVAHLTASPAPDHPWFDQFGSDQYPLVIAHAGSELYPHDTLFALKEYAAMQVDVLEMDLHMTADGEIILIHDDTVDRTTDGNGDVREMTLGEVQALDAGPVPEHIPQQDGAEGNPEDGQRGAVHGLPQPDQNSGQPAGFHVQQPPPPLHLRQSDT